MKLKAKRPVHFRKRTRSNWVALGAAGLVACGSASGPAVSSAYAGQQQAVNAAQSPVSQEFNIAAGALSDVLAEFESVTGLKITLARAEELGRLASPGVQGRFTPDRALTQILTGTGILFRRTAENELTLDLEATPVSIAVSSTPDVAPSSPKYTAPLRDIPQTIEVIPRTILEQQGAVTLSDALRNVPGITLQAGEGGGASNTAGDMITIRGFNGSNSIFVDGVRDDGLVSRNVYNLEQVEVFLGPTGTDVGRGTASGYVNMQTKTPSLRSAYAATFAYASADQTRTTFDLNQPVNLGPAGSWLNRAALRFNTFWQGGGVSGRDKVQLSNRSIAPAITLGLGTPTRVTYAGQFTRQRNLPDYGIPTVAWPNDTLREGLALATSPVRQTNYYGSPGYDFDHVSQNSHTVRIERDVTENFTLRNQTRYNETHRFAVVTGLGTYAPSTQTVALTRQGNERTNRIGSNQSNAVGRLTVAGMRHAISGGVEYTYEDQFAPTLTGVGTRAAVDVYNPNPYDAVTGYAVTRTGALTKGWTNTLALYAFDSVNISSRWQFSGGFRWEHYATNFRTISAANVLTASERADDGLRSGKAGILYRLTEAANLYFSYGTSATPPGTANFTLSAQANNQDSPNVEPQLSKNYELGGKWDLFGSRLSLNAAAFHTRNENVIFTVDASATPPIFNQDDGQKVRGLTFGATGYITRWINILASWGWLNSHLETQNAATNGNRLVLTPPRSGSLWTTVLLPGRVTVGGGLRYSDMVHVNAANTIRSPRYVLADAVVDYAAGDRLSLRLNISNLTNAAYVRTVNNNGNRYNPGEPRTFMLTSSVKF